MNNNYWKCRVYKRSKYRWEAVVLETDVVVVRCGTWLRAVHQAIKFQAIQHRTHGRGWSISNELKAINRKLQFKEKNKHGKERER